MTGTAEGQVTLAIDCNKLKIVSGKLADFEAIAKKVQMEPECRDGADKGTVYVKKDTAPAIVAAEAIRLQQLDKRGNQLFDKYGTPRMIKDADAIRFAFEDTRRAFENLDYSANGVTLRGITGVSRVKVEFVR